MRRIRSSRPARSRRTSCVAGIAAAFVAAMAVPAFLLGAPAAAEEQAPEPAAPQLSVTLSNGVDELSAGDELTFTAEVRNFGAALEARVVLAPPAYVALGGAEGATVEANTATWVVPIDAGSTATLEIPAAVGGIPETETRVTTLVSVYVGESTAPVVRTAVANHIVGVADDPKPGPGQSDGGAALLAWIIAGGVLVVLLAAAAVVLLLRRRRRVGSAESATGRRRA